MTAKNLYLTHLVFFKIQTSLEVLQTAAQLTIRKGISYSGNCNQLAYSTTL